MPQEPRPEGQRLYMVIPCYNEEEVLPETAKRLRAKYDALIAAGRIAKNSRILLVNDGSKDGTWEIIERLHESDPVFSGIKLSRNRGHQNALLAGLLTAKGHADITISMDADLQDDINVIDKFLDEYYQNGCDVVYGVRSSRKKDTFFKRATAEGFYKFMRLMGVDIVFNHADCRLMSRRAVEGLGEFREVNLFLRGVVPLVGYKSAVATYERSERFAGESKYPLKKMLSFAFDGITSFSIKPIRLITTLGVLIFLFSFLILLYALIRWATGNTVPGWTFLIFSIWMLGGIQLLSLGVIGEYVGKIYAEAKARPKYIIETFLNED